MMYARMELKEGAASQPAALPFQLLGLADESLADLSAALDPAPTTFAGVGYWPVDVQPTPPFDPRSQTVSTDVDLDVDTDARRVRATPRLRDLTAEEIDALPSMDSLRASALARAIAYGNRLTQGEISQWAGVEPFSWGLQRDEAAIVRAGGALGEGAVLPELAADKGVTLAEYADDVWANAMRYQAVLKAAVYLRRAATTVLTDEGLDTPEKLAEAVAALTVEADALAAQLLGG